MEYFILLELCTGGSLIDLIRRRNNRPLGEVQICDLFIQICQGVAKMHSQKPPIAHRDIKIENVLIGTKGTLKLCDFGSCTTRAQVYQSQRERVEEEEIIGSADALITGRPAGSEETARR
jgi:serine/threonine protein kinase